MRWFYVFLVFASGIAVGIAFSAWKSNDYDKSQARELIGAGDAAVPPANSTEVLRPGNVAGFLRDAEDFDAFAKMIGELSTREQLDALALWRQQRGADIRAALRQAEIEISVNEAGAAIAGLLASAAEVDSLRWQQQFEKTLAAAVDLEARRLTAEGRFQKLDALLEEITLTLPELGVYFLRLGTLRVQSGANDGALAVLSQIQNHGEFGAAARSLLDDLSGERDLLVAGVEMLPLQKRGDQFIVEAELGNGAVLLLLIDTGASMTVISRRSLESLGYVIDGPTAYFSTAGGVVEAPVMTLPVLSLGAASVRQLSVGVLPIDLPGNIDGLLGMNYLRHFEFRIDQEGARLSLDSSAN